MASDIKRVPYPEHPQRCPSPGNGEQCMMYIVEGGKNCRIHGGAGQQHMAKKQGLKNYQLTVFRARLERHSSSLEIKSVREEIGVLRMVLETRLNDCKTDVDLVINSGPIADLVVKIDKLVTSCHRLEGSMGELLDKSAILQLANVMITIISEEVSNPDEMNKVADRILAEVGKIGDLDG